MEKLLGSDYMTFSFLDLVGHPDFSQEAMTAITKVTRMDTATLEKLGLHIQNMEEDSNG